jgi:hypothetical protein
VGEEEQQACGHVASNVASRKGGGKPVERAADARQSSVIGAHRALKRAAERAQQQALARLCSAKAGLQGAHDGIQLWSVGAEQRWQLAQRT